MSNFDIDRLAIVSITAENLVETAHFYRDVLGLRLLPHHGHRPAFDLGGVVLVVVEGEAGQKMGGKKDFPVLTFSVKDIHEALEHLSEHGIETLDGIMQKGDTRWILFHDPAGNLVELAQFGSDIKT